MGNSCLVADIGGTNARFALLKPGTPELVKGITYPCNQFPSFELALRHYLDAVEIIDPDIICLAVAGPVVDESVNFTNNAWQICAADLADEFQGARVKLLNDFEAVAYALPGLGASELSMVGAVADKGFGSDQSSLCVIGPGTGLGCAGLLTQQGRRSVIVSEAGQVGFAPQSSIQLEVLGILTTQLGRISNERLLSGPGIENIYGALASIRGEPTESLSAQKVFAAAKELQAGDLACELATQTIDLFFEILGQVAGDLALSLYAIDGLYIAGGIARRYPKILEDSLFRAGFENKGEYRSLMERIPTHLITYENPGLLGAAQFALDM